MELDVIYTKIYLVRGKNVMLDFDLALLYETETKKLKQAVRRNSRRFPEDFMFELTRTEFTQIKEKIRSQNVTHVSLSDTYMPFAFTEQGVAMLASILKSEKAIEVNIEIVRTFVLMREYALSYKDLAERLAELEGRFSDISQAIHYLLSKDEQTEEFKSRKRIGYKPT